MKKRVLIVEDNIVNRNILVKILSSEYETLQAENGKVALRIIEEQYRELSAVVLDLYMPEMSGKELMSVISEDKKFSNLPILIATGEHNAELESECLSLGAWDFVTKPYNAAVIRLRLRNIIGRSQITLMQKIRYLAERDPLTNAYNRPHFFDETVKMLEENKGTRFVMIRMDVDHFRLFNSAYGTKAGNMLLLKLAEGIEHNLKENQVSVYTYGHLESDVFCICIPYHETQLEKILNQSENEIQGYSASYRLKASFGLYVIENTEENMEEIEEMYSHTVDASRVCKDNMNLLFAYYTREMGKRAERAQQLTNEMASALKQEQFQVYLQPKYSIETGKPCGAEALVRWLHPTWGMVSPGDFIPVFEQNGLIIQLDYYMWEHVCMLLQKWNREGREMFPVSVNISRISLYNPKIVEDIVGLTEKYNIPRYLLNLEITESAYMSSQDMMKEIIDKFHEMGFLILMDDFGSGYSSLNTLKDIDVDILKIDMKFLPTGHNNAKSEKILASVARMAGWLGMPVVVEGVETKEQRDFLESIGCTYVQGYFYARPMPVPDYELLISSQNKVQEDKKQNPEEILSDFDTIWSSDSSTGALLKGISVPFAIMEYGNYQMDILRSNKAFVEQFKGNHLEKYLIHKENSKLLNALDEIVISKDKNECECLFVMPQGNTAWYQIHLCFIGTIGKTSLVSATFTDITIERKLENELNSVFHVLKGPEKTKSSLLIVDDLAMSREVLVTLFEDEFDILQASDGEEGLEILGNHEDNIAAILLDMMMPKMGGREFLSYKNKMENAADIPIIVISAEDDEAMQIHMLENGVNDYVTKPFIPAIVKKRLRNVLEYNSRFRTLVREYRDVNNLFQTHKGNISLSSYALPEVREMIHFMNRIFDLVRLVDPSQTAVITIGDDDSVREIPYSCFSIWGKSVRCENCSSMCAMTSRCALNKFELLKKDIFYVVSQPVEVRLADGETRQLILEIASKVKNEKNMEQKEADELYDILNHTYGLIYEDTLTSAYNRRFFDDMLFLHHGQNQVARKLSIVMADLYHFGKINDLFGHQTGDRVLKDVVEAIKKNIRENDSVVRYGGDVFVIILPDCDEKQVELSIKRFRAAIRDVFYGPGNTISVEVDFGYAISSDFSHGSEELQTMMQQADEMMYQSKRRHQDNQIL